MSNYAEGVAYVESRTLVPDDDRAHLRHIPLHAGMSEADMHLVFRALAGSVKKLQTHSHTETCKKGGRAGTDADCRMSYPRQLVRSTYCDQATGSIFMRREDPTLVPYCPTLTLAAPSNTAFYVLSEQGRFLRELYEYERRVRAGEPPGVRPGLATIEECAADAGEYACKYATKPDNVNLQVPTMNIMAELERAHNQIREGVIIEPDTARSLHTVRHVINQLQRSTTFSSVQISAYLQGHGDHRMSHSTLFYNERLFTHLRCPSEEEEDHYRPIFDSTERIVRGDDANGPTVAHVNKFVDWKYRPTHLRSFPPYFYSMFFDKKRQDSVYHAQVANGGTVTRGNQVLRYSFHESHPQFGTHMVQPRPRAVLQQITTRLPMIPLEGSVDDAAKEKYASFALANFSSGLEDCLRSEHDRETETDEYEMLDTGWSSRTVSGLDVDLVRPAYPDHLSRLLSQAGRDLSPSIDQAATSAEASVLPAASIATEPLASVRVTSTTPHWDMYQRWMMCGLDKALYGRKVLANIDTHTRTQHRSSVAAALRRDEMNAALNSPSTVQPSTGPFDDEESPPPGYGPGEGETEDSAHDRSLAQMPELTAEYVAELLSSIQGDGNNPVSDYLSAAVHPIRDALSNLLTVPIQLNSNAGHIHQIPNTPASISAFNRSTKAATAATKAFRRAQVDSPSTANRLRSLRFVPRTTDSPAHVVILERRDLTENAPTQQTHLAPGTCPPYLPMFPCPSIQQVVQIFGLASDQALPFILQAETLDAMIEFTSTRNGNRVRPAQLLSNLTGEPGSGKTQVLLAFLWYAFQRNASHHIAVTAYTWRAAQQASTESNIGLSTSNFFCVSPNTGQGPPTSDRQIAEMQHKMADIWFICIDESSFLSMKHLAGISQSATNACHAIGRCDTREAIFGGVHVLMSGDPYQHAPPNATPLYVGAAAEAATEERLLRNMNSTPSTQPLPPIPVSDTLEQHPESERSAPIHARLSRSPTTSVNGRQIYLSFTTAFHLTSQHRFNPADPGGCKLQAIIQPLMSLPPVPSAPAIEKLQHVQKRRADVTYMLDELQATVVGNMSEQLQGSVHVLVLRNKVRNELGPLLALADARRLKVLAMQWRATDTMKTTTGEIVLNDSVIPGHGALLRAMESVPIKALGEFSATNIFFPGCEYLFIDSNAHNAGRAKNSKCIGRAIVLDPRELPPTPAMIRAGCQTLRYVPYAIDVQPIGVEIGDAIGNGVTQGCIRVSI